MQVVYFLRHVPPTKVRTAGKCIFLLLFLTLLISVLELILESIYYFKGCKIGRLGIFGFHMYSDSLLINKLATVCSLGGSDWTSSHASFYLSLDKGRESSSGRAMLRISSISPAFITSSGIDQQSHSNMEAVLYFAPSARHCNRLGLPECLAVQC